MAFHLGHHCLTKYLLFMSLKIVFILANSADSDEMPHYAAFHLGLHCLTKYLLFLSLKIVFILANSADPDEMLRYRIMRHFICTLFDKVPIYRYPERKGLIFETLYNKA